MKPPLKLKGPRCPNPLELDPTVSPIAYFGFELRRYRKEAGLSQTQLADRAGYSVGASMAETGKRPPTAEFVQKCDGALDEGALLRIKAMIDNVAAQLPAWFRPWAEIEQSAESLRTWQPLIVHGLLQTPDYARAILHGNPGVSPEKVEASLAARMERQQILHREDAPMLWVVLDEAVLARPIGEGSVMADQLDHLLESARQPRITIQVLPFEALCATGLLGGFIVAKSHGMPDIAYLESSPHGRVVDRLDAVSTVTTWYEAIRAEALPQHASLKLIKEKRDQWKI